MNTPDDSDEATARRTTTQARKNARADDGRSAMMEYEREQEAIAKRTARLRALRLEKEAEAAAEAAKPKPVAAKPKPAAKAPKTAAKAPSKKIKTTAS